MKRLVLIAGLMLAAASAWASPMGTWRVTDGTANIEIAPCGSALCGTIAWTDKPDQKDNKNPDVSQRNRLVLGIAVLQNMQPRGDKWIGSVYNARDGRTYDAKISMRGDDTLRIEGCIANGMLCGGQNWGRVAQPTIAAEPATAMPRPQTKEAAVITPVTPMGEAVPEATSQVQQAQVPASVPTQEQANVAPQVPTNTGRSARLLDLGLSQITAEQAAVGGRSAADLINQMLVQHEVRGARVDRVQAAEAARSATKIINRYLR